MNKEIINCKNAAPALGPYSHSVKTNNMLFVSGQIPITKNGKIVDGTIEEELEQVMNNIKIILKESSADLENIVKSSIFLKNMNDFTEVNNCYAKYFSKNPPARECVEVSRLPKDVRIEISVIATL